MYPGGCGDCDNVMISPQCDLFLGSRPCGTWVRCSQSGEIDREGEKLEREKREREIERERERERERDRETERQI